MSITIRQLGLDFGSSVTSVVGFADEYDKPILFLPKGSSYFFTAIAKHNAKEEYYFFGDAFQFSANSSYRYSSTFKENIKNEKELAKLFLTEVFRQVKQYEKAQVPFDFSKLEQVIYGYPEYYDSDGAENYCSCMDDILLEIVSTVFGKKPAVKSAAVSRRGATNKKKDELVTSHGEPLLASVAYKWSKERTVEGVKYDVGDKLLALDFGGHTLDMALVDIGEGGVIKPIKCKSQQISVSGTGKRITALVCRKAGVSSIDTGVENAKIALFSGDSSRMTDYYKLKHSDGRVALKYDESNDDIIIEVISSHSGRTQTSTNVADVYEEAASHIVKFLENVNVDSHSIKHVLFTGGTSRIVYLRELILKYISGWLVSNRNVNQIDEMLNSDEAGRALEGAVLVMANTINQYNRGNETAMTAETAVALGAALVARDSKMLGSVARKCGESPVRKAGFSAGQERHFGAIRLNIENVIRNFEQASSPDVKMYISKARVIEKLREADTMLQSIPKG